MPSPPDDLERVWTGDAGPRDRNTDVRQYANPSEAGMRHVAAAARDAGVDGVLIIDYPVEAAEPMRRRVAAQLYDLYLADTSDEASASSNGRGVLSFIRAGFTRARADMGRDGGATGRKDPRTRR